jgi:hypothetical protein
MGAREALFFSLVYTAGILGTFGHFYRSYQGQLRPRHFLYTLLWPLWWVCAKGVGGTFDALLQCGGVALKGLAMTAPQIAGLYWAWVLSLAA